MTAQARRIPDALLERYVTDSLTGENKARLEAQLAASAEDQARLAELRADSAAFLLKYPPRVVVQRFEQDRRRARWRWPLLLVPALAAATVAVLVLRQPPEDPFTAKGSVILRMNRKADTGVVKVEEGSTLVPQDKIEFEVKAPKNGFVAVLSKDAKGVSVYYSVGGVAPAPYDARQPRLPVSFVLDDTLGREDIYALYSPSPFELGWAKQALEEGRELKEAAAARSISVKHTFFIKQASRPQK